MHFFLKEVPSGLVFGGIYALVAFGLALGYATASIEIVRGRSHLLGGCGSLEIVRNGRNGVGFRGARSRVNAAIASLQ